MAILTQTMEEKERNKMPIKKIKDMLKSKDPKKVPLGSGGAGKAKKVITGRQKQIEDALKKSGAY